MGGRDMQITLRWSRPADLDQHVADPATEEIYYGHSTWVSGGILNHDANASRNGTADDDIAVENVFWPPRSASAGNYIVWVKWSPNVPGPWTGSWRSAATER